MSTKQPLDHRTVLDLAAELQRREEMPPQQPEPLVLSYTRAGEPAREVLAPVELDECKLFGALPLYIERIAPGQAATVTVSPQRCLRPEYLVVAPMSAGLLIHQLLIGNCIQVAASSAPMPASVFGVELDVFRKLAEAALESVTFDVAASTFARWPTPRLQLDVVQPGVRVTLRVMNLEDRIVPLAAMLLGEVLR